MKKQFECLNEGILYTIGEVTYYFLQNAKS